MDNNKYQLLKEWHELLKSGAITEDDFNKKKTEILGEPANHDPEIGEIVEQREVIEDAVVIEDGRTESWIIRNKVWVTVLVFSVVVGVGLFFWYVNGKTGNLDWISGDSKIGVEHNKEQNLNNMIDMSIIRQIMHYCEIESSNLDKNLNDSLLIADSAVDEDGEYVHYYIPLRFDYEIYTANSAIGDLNDDQKDDVVVSVYYELGGRAGGNSYGSKIFVFIQNENGYKLTDVLFPGDLCGCEPSEAIWSGRYMVSHIEDNRLVGRAFCYRSDDPSSNPSLEYCTKAILKDNKLVYYDKVLSVDSRDQEEALWEEYGVEYEPEYAYDESMPASKYFKIDNVVAAYFEDEGKFVLSADVKNIYHKPFSVFHPKINTFIKLKNSDQYCRVYHSVLNQQLSEAAQIKDWQPGEVKRLEGNSRCFFCIEGFHQTPEEIYVELSATAISIDAEPDGVFARWALLDLWKAKQTDLGIR